MSVKATRPKGRAFQETESSAAEHDVLVDRNVAVPMRDGVCLQADIYRPRTPGRYPVLIERIGYDRTARCAGPGNFFAQHGYVFVGQGVRGLYGSEGEFAPLRDDGWGIKRDGYDTIEWAAEQMWSSGSVGMLDGSYSGYAQYLAAVTRPPHLRALCVRSGPSNIYHDWGVPRRRSPVCRARMGSSLRTPPPVQSTSPTRLRIEDALQDLERWCEHLPVRSCPPLEGLADWYVEWFNNPTYGPYWHDLDVAKRLEDIGVPAVHLVGWFDVCLDASLRCFTGLRERGRSDACRAAQRLIIGPW